jgi:alkylmercury lyase
MNEKPNEQDARLDAMARELQVRFLAYAPGQRRLLVQMARDLAHGRPLTPEQVDQRILTLGLDRDASHRFLRERTERDADDRIVGALGLSLGDHPHRLRVDGVSLSAWCALDTLFLPTLLRQTATIVSSAPLTHAMIRLRVSPERVEEVDPAGAVLSFVLQDPSRERAPSVEAIWNVFCRHVHFFATCEEAERWAGEREDIAILTMDEGFALGRRIWSGVLAESKKAQETGVSDPTAEAGGLPARRARPSVDAN